MPWMMLWAGGFPVYVAEAAGARITDVDGHSTSTSASATRGRCRATPPPRSATRSPRQLDAGITTMLPSEDAAWVGEELRRRFGVDRWTFTLTATDANRTALRLARELTGRPLVLVYSYCYHGSVDESFAVAGPDGTHASRAPATSGRRSTRRRRRGRSSSTTSRRSSERWHRATSPACWPSRR